KHAKVSKSGIRFFRIAFFERRGDRPAQMLAGQSYRRNLAIPVARRGAVVTGVDIAPNLLEQARERAKREAVEVTFDEGDAEELPYGDASFDLVISMFGAMFAPRRELVATELMRICRPGGPIAMANWTAGAAP